MTGANAGGLVSAVERGSLAAKIGIRPGDRLLRVNGHPVADVLDVQFHAAEDDIRLEWSRRGRTHAGEAHRQARSALGLAFDRPTFDIDIRHCNNLCPFCFVTQMAPGMRRTLHVKDDDYRYSFLYGHFVTLTNLTERDWNRIAGQHLSPLYVSVHATEPDVRAACLGRTHGGDILERLRFLAANGIQIHTQAVLLPGVNDGPHLERTLRDLAALYPAVRSCSVVPVGVTRFQRRGVRPYTPQEMEPVIRAAEDWQRESLARLGSRFAFLTDEWYLATGREVPPAGAYEDIDLRENGLGVTRDFLEDWNAVAARLPARPPSSAAFSATLVTGTLFARTLETAAREYSARTGASFRMKAVPNRRLGESVTVAGLLMGRDVIAALKDDTGSGPILLPRVMFDHPQAISLDDLSPLDIAQALGREVFLAATMDDVHKTAAGKNPLRASPRAKSLPRRFYRAGGWEG